MNKKTWGILGAVITLATIGGFTWAVADYWHSYCAVEIIHETSQDEQIEIAMKQSTLAIIQQRIAWLEQRIWEIEKEYNCPDCSGTIKRTYKKYVEEYEALQMKVQKLTEG